MIKKKKMSKKQMKEQEEMVILRSRGLHLAMPSEPEDEDSHPGKEYFLAGDPAKQHDYFGIVLLQRVNNTIKLIGMKELQLDYTVVANYMQLLYRRWHVRKVFLDQTGVGNVFLDMLKAKHLLVEGIQLSNPKKLEIIETVIRLIQEGKLKLPKNGANELKQQLQTQERDLTESGLVRLKHPSGSHDDLFWAFCIGVYGIKKILDKGSRVPIFVSKNWRSGSYGERGHWETDVASLSDEELFPELDRPGIEVTDIAKHIPS